MASVAVAPHDELRLLYREHHGWLLGWLRGRISCKADAADMAQDVFVRVLQKDCWQMPDEPRAYLATIARGMVINLHQRRALEQAYLDVLATLPEPQTPSAEHRYLILETLYEVQRALASLPREGREVFLLSQLDGLTYAQIAERLGLSIRTVNRHMVRAFERCLAVCAP